MRIPSNIKRLIIIVLISFLTIGTILYFTADKDTVKKVLNMDRKFFLIGVMFYFIVYTLDALRTKILIHGTGHKFKFIECYKLIAFQVFFDIITPFSFGGQPFQVYILHKKKVPGGSATTVVMTKLIFGGLVITSFVVWAIFAHSALFANIPTIKYLVEIVGSLLIVGITLFVMGLYNPQITTNILTLFFKLLWRLKLLRHPDKFKMKIMKHIILARDSFDGFIGHRFLYFITGLIISYIQFFCLIVMVVFFMWGLDINITLSLGIALTSSLLFLIALMPTPGASGLGEGLFYLLYKDYIPGNLIAVVIFLWRFFHQYLTAIIGVFVTGHYGSELLSKKISRKEKTQLE